jgi:hypothetical protein
VLVVVVCDVELIVVVGCVEEDMELVDETAVDVICELVVGVELEEVVLVCVAKLVVVLLGKNAYNPTPRIIITMTTTTIIMVRPIPVF